MLFNFSARLDNWILLASAGFLSKGVLWALCITPLVAAALWAGVRGAGKLFAGLMLLALVAARLPLLCYDVLNPDEAFFVSEAMRMSADPVPYRAADSLTSGPLNVYALAIPGWFGSTPSYASARLTATLLMFGTLALLWLALRELTGPRPAALAVMPVFCFLAYASEPSFTHASSEHVAIFLCALGGYLAARDYRGGAESPARWNLALGAVASAMLFAKLQSLPLAAVLLLASAALAWRKSRRAVALAALAAGAVAIPALFLAVFWRYGVLREFWLSYFGRGMAYVGITGLSPARKLLEAWWLLWYRSLMKWYLLGMLPVWLAGLWAEWRRPLSAVAAAFMLAGIAAVAGPGRDFEHYLLFLLIPFVAITAAAVERVRIPGALFVAVACILPTVASVSFESEHPMAWNHPHFEPSGELVNLVRRYSSPHEDLVVWGWRSALNVAAGRMPGTRFPDTQLQIEEAPFRPFFRQIYLADFARSRPPVFIDAVGPGAFGFDDRTMEGYETFDGLRETIAREYRQVAETDGARVFVRADRLAE